MDSEKSESDYARDWLAWAGVSHFQRSRRISRGGGSTADVRREERSTRPKVRRSSKSMEHNVDKVWKH